MYIETGGTTMSVLEDLQKLKDAEDFLNYFKIEYDDKVVKPYRLHILKKFSLYVKEVIENHEHLDDEKLYDLLREGLMKAYETFLHSDPIKERLFSVHKNAVFFINLEIENHDRKEI
jgi:nitrogenase-stabilizing/protective protein